MHLNSIDVKNQYQSYNAIVQILSVIILLYIDDSCVRYDFLTSSIFSMK